MQNLILHILSIMGKCHICQLFNTDHDTKSCPWLICKNCGKSGHAVKFCPKMKFQALNKSVISENSTPYQKCHEVFKESHSKIESDPKILNQGKDQMIFFSPYSKLLFHF